MTTWCAAVLAACLGCSVGVAADGGGLTCLLRESDRSVEIADAGRPVLRYHHGNTRVPDGVDPVFERGDYVGALYGLDGELLTDDYPADHVHHRGVNWSWATVTWNGQERDMFGLRNPYVGDPIIGGLWQRPSGPTQCAVDAGHAVVKSECRWVWDDTTPVVAESVRIEVAPAASDRRLIDFTIRLTPLVDGIQFAGRRGAGYSGFNLRMAPGEEQRIDLHVDEPDARPRRAFGSYSSRFAGAPGRSGVAVLQHPANPSYPSAWREYPELNFFQPAFPGVEMTPMHLGQTIVLRYRLVVHRGDLSKSDLAGLWDAYAAHPTQD